MPRTLSGRPVPLHSYNRLDQWKFPLRREQANARNQLSPSQIMVLDLLQKIQQCRQSQHPRSFRFNPRKSDSNPPDLPRVTVGRRPLRPLC
jgi:hypothetical protein